MLKWILLLLLLPATGFGFTFTVTPTAESCTGNGALTFLASNTDPAGSIVFEVYLLPNTTVPIATVTSNILNGLSAGDYRIIAKETVGANVTSQQQDVTITNSVVPLSYSIQSFNQACSSNSNITINIISGTAATYEIFSGPITFPPQASDTFIGLPVGVYRIRVFDNCGTGVVSTFTVTLNPTGLTIGPATFSNTTPPSCNFTIANHIITPAAGTVIGYPLAIEFNVHPPGGGAPITFNSILNNGNLTSQQISETIPFYVNQNYDYDVTILDACGSTFTQNFIANQDITLLPAIYPLICNTNFFKLNVTNFTPPYTLNFTVAPPGFNPAAFNADYPFPYNDASVTFGSATNTVPLGNYEVIITDLCGRTTTTPFTIFSIPATPTANATNNGCLTNSGKIVIAILNFKIVTATITAAPASYPFPLPHDVSFALDIPTGVLNLNPVPIGDYTFVLTDECSDLLSPLNVTVPVYVDQGLASEVRPGCDLQKSSVKISSKNGALNALTITAAPAGFAPTLPYDGLANIANDGNFYMNGLTAGNYTFQAVDVCGFSNSITINVVGYTITNATFSLQANCGSFDIPLNFVSNGTINQSFWLQKQMDATANTWGDPNSGTLYTEGTVPNATNSYPLTNNATTYNLTFNGTFRIIRTFSTFNNGSEINSGSVTSIDKNCIEILSPTLYFNQVLEITDANRMPCSASGSLDVIISANGTAPLHYSISEKDGLPFVFDNGTSNIFYNLAPGIYMFVVQDNCGNSRPRPFDLSALRSLITITQPQDLLLCQNTITGNETFDLTPQSPIILGTQSPTDYTLSYHESLSDAQNNINAIANLSTYNPASTQQTVYARVIYNPLPNCYETTSFDLYTGEKPKLILNTNYDSCASTPVTLDASTNNLLTTTYVWSDGSTNPTLTVSQIGVNNISVSATNAYGPNNLPCPNAANITVTISEAPVVDHIETNDWTYDNNSITVFTSNNGTFEYSLDNINYQSQNTFEHLQAGVYDVYVRDIYRCGYIKKEVWLLYFPNFFTPNDDGYNDTWSIKNADFEPDLTVFIYDRFGKLMKYLDRTNKSWDGTYNNHQAVSSDYWFVVNRQDGRVHKGHFTLKR